MRIRSLLIGVALVMPALNVANVGASTYSAATSWCMRDMMGVGGEAAYTWLPEPSPPRFSSQCDSAAILPGGQLTHAETANGDGTFSFSNAAGDAPGYFTPDGGNGAYVARWSASNAQLSQVLTVPPGSTRVEIVATLRVDRLEVSATDRAIGIAAADVTTGLTNPAGRPVTCPDGSQLRQSFHEVQAPAPVGNVTFDDSFTCSQPMNLDGLEMGVWVSAVGIAYSWYGAATDDGAGQLTAVTMSAS
ncbi:MAG: hypothetical protein ACYDAY_09115 [Candidatus Dormibacteria bacterium]